MKLLKDLKAKDINQSPHEISAVTASTSAVTNLNASNNQGMNLSDISIINPDESRIGI